MKKVLSGAIIIALCLGISGCSSRGYNTANHNGKYYYFPDNCSQFRYYNSDRDRLYCLNNGQETGVVITPASNAQVQNHLYQQRSNQQALDSMNRNLQMQNQNFQLQQMNNNLQGLRYGY